MITSSFPSPQGFIFADGLGAAKKTTKKTPVKAPTAAKASVRRLQTALVTLGKIAGSATLKAIKIDGALGSKTVDAVNLTFTKHIGPGQAAAQYRTGALTLAFVATNADTLAALIETEIRRRGSAAPSPTVAKQAELVKAIKQAPTPITKEIAKRLQRALVDLGKVTGSATLKAIKVDGALGAKTVAAVNWAFTNHIGSGQAPAQYRTGKLDMAAVQSNASTLASLIETEIKRRASVAKAPAVTAGPAKILPLDARTAARDLQTALVNLGKATGSAQLKTIKVDGALGAKTVAAVNWAFTKHIGAGQAPAKYRTGRLTLNDVKANIGELINLIFVETRRRGGTAMVPTSTKIPVKTKTGKIVKARQVPTASGETTYEVTDPTTQETFYTSDPTTAPTPETIKPAPATVPAEAAPSEEPLEAETAPAPTVATSPTPRVAPAVTPSTTATYAPAAAQPDAGQNEIPGAGALVPQDSGDGGGGFFSRYKYAIVGAGLLAAGGIGLLLMRRRGASASTSVLNPRKRVYA